MSLFAAVSRFKKIDMKYSVLWTRITTSGICAFHALLLKGKDNQTFW